MTENLSALAAVLDHADRRDGDHDAIEPMVEVLTESGDRSLLPTLNRALDRYLDEKNDRGRDLMARIMAAIAGITALPVLLLAADRDLGDDQRFLQEEIDLLLRADPDDARRIVVDLIRSTVPERQRAGLEGLAALVRPEDVPLLAGAATEADAAIRLLALEALPDPGGDDRAFEVLVAALRDPDEKVRLSVIRRIAGIRRAGAVAPLAAIAGDPSSEVRARVAFALGRIADPSGRPTLLTLLDDPERTVRDNAREALGAVGGADAVDALSVEATDPDPRRRVLVAKAFAQLAGTDPRAETQLLLLARDTDPKVRAAVLSGLATVGDATGRWESLVTELAGDPDVAVRHRVIGVASHLVPDPAGLLERLADDPSGFVREAALQRLRSR